MSKKVLIISTTMRKGGNSEIMANEFAKGALEAGHDVEQISLCGKNINFCKGCLSCQKTQRCVIHDDADIISQKMLTAEVIVFATPIYYYEMSGQMKTMLDRANPLYSSNYEFRDIYLLATAADTDEISINGAMMGLVGWITCFEHARFAGKVFAGGADELGTVQNIPLALKAAYDKGINA